jgi:hypothetical protein
VQTHVYASWVPIKNLQIVKDIGFRQARFCLIAGDALLECLCANIPAKLASSSKPQSKVFDFSPGGYGIHWPLMDEHHSIDSLLRTNPKPPTQTNGMQA